MLCTLHSMADNPFLSRIFWWLIVAYLPMKDILRWFLVSKGLHPPYERHLVLVPCRKWSTSYLMKSFSNRFIAANGLHPLPIPRTSEKIH